MKERTRRFIWDNNGEKWKKLRDEFNWCQISTFHSFCARLIRERPLESGISPGFGVMEDMQAEELKLEVFEHLLSLTKQDPLASTVVTILSETSERFLKDALWLMFKQRAELEDFLSSFKDPSELIKRWKKMSEDLVGCSSESFLKDEIFLDSIGVLADLAIKYAGDRDSACRYLASANEQLEMICSEREPSRVFMALNELSSIKGSRAMGSAKVFTSKDLDRLRTAYNVVRTKLDACAFESLSVDGDDDLRRAADLTCALKDVYLRFEGLIQERKRQANVLDFEDMVQIVHRMLHEDKALANEPPAAIIMCW